MNERTPPLAPTVTREPAADNADTPLICDWICVASAAALAYVPGGMTIVAAVLSTDRPTVSLTPAVIVRLAGAPPVSVPCVASWLTESA